MWHISALKGPPQQLISNSAERESLSPVAADDLAQQVGSGDLAILKDQLVCHLGIQGTKAQRCLIELCGA